MGSFTTELEEARAQSVTVEDDRLIVELVDGRAICVPLAWFPRLWYGKPAERALFTIIGDGKLLHWPELDEDLAVAGLLAGRRSSESAESLKRWLQTRKNDQ